MGRYYSGNIEAVKQAMFRDAMNNIMGRAPAEAREVYSQFNSMREKEDSNMMNQEQMEQVNEAFDKKLVATAKAISLGLNERVDDLEAKLNRQKHKKLKVSLG